MTACDRYGHAWYARRFGGIGVWAMRGAEVTLLHGRRASDPA
ncbi:MULTISPECIES: hypothetical protein [Bacteria]